MGCVNALCRAYSISTPMKMVRSYLRLDVSMPCVGLIPFLPKGEKK